MCVCVFWLHARAHDTATVVAMDRIMDANMLGIDPCQQARGRAAPPAMRQQQQLQALSKTNAYLKACGTQATDTPIEMPRSERSPQDSPSSSRGGSPLSAMIEVEFTRAMSLLLVPDETMYLPPLGEGEYYVVQAYASGLKRTVVERQNNILSIDEVRQHQAECDKAMLDELQRWNNLKAFERMPKALAHNVVDSRWVLKWKEVNGKRIIQARLVVRGFKDLQASQLNTFAGTTTRWGQRLVNSVAAQHRWPLFTADVSQAFLRGLTFEQAAQGVDVAP